MNRNETIREIRSALKRRSDRANGRTPTTFGTPYWD
jgi:hypothetical protein